MKVYTYDADGKLNGFYIAESISDKKNNNNRTTDKQPPDPAPNQDVIFDPGVDDWVLVDNPEKLKATLKNALAGKLKQVNAWIDSKIEQNENNLSNKERQILSCEIELIRSEARGGPPASKIIKGYLKSGKDRKKAAEELANQFDSESEVIAPFIAQANEWRDQIKQLYDDSDLEGLHNFNINTDN